MAKDKKTKKEAKAPEFKLTIGKVTNKKYTFKNEEHIDEIGEVLSRAETALHQPGVRQVNISVK